MKKILCDFAKKGKFISVYKNFDDRTKFSFGKVIAVDQTHYALIETTPEGSYDGITVGTIDSIIRLEENGLYEKKMNSLLLKETFDDKVFDLDEKNIVLSVLKKSQEEKIVLSIELLDSSINDVSGVVQKIEGNICTLNIIDNYGFDDGIAYFKIDDITQISLDTEFEQTLQKLHKEIKS